MKIIFLFSLIFVLSWCNAQIKEQSAKIDKEGSTLSDSMKKYFNYDTLHNFLCQEVPTGIYALSFRIDRAQKLYDIQFSCNDLPALNYLFTVAFQKAVKSIGLPFSDKKYLQLVYFNNILGCNNSSDTLISESKSIAKQQLQLYVRQLTQIENTFNLIRKEGDCIVLKPVTINDNNPNSPRSKTGFYNDQTGHISQELSEKATKEIENKKKEKFHR